MIVPLSREMRQVLGELELLSHGTVQAWNKTAQGAERDTRPKGGETLPPHEEFRIEWEIADTDDERHAVLKAARDYLKQWRVRDPGRNKPKTRTPIDIDKEMRGFAGWTPREIARRTGNVVTEGQIMEWRKGRKLDPSTGYEVRIEPVEDKAKRLHGQGLSIRQIADAVGAPKSNIARLLKDAA